MSFLNKCFLFSLWFWWLDQHNKGREKEYIGKIFLEQENWKGWMTDVREMGGVQQHMCPTTSCKESEQHHCCALGAHCEGMAVDGKYRTNASKLTQLGLEKKASAVAGKAK